MKKQKDRKKQNLIAAAVMAGLILLAMPLGVAHSLDDLRDDAEGQYYSDQAGYSISDGITRRQEAATNLLTVAGRYVDDHEELSYYWDWLNSAIVASQKNYDLSQEAQLNAEMGQAAEELAAALEGIELESRDQKYPDQLIAQMQSEQDKIQRSSYNDSARDFNRRLTVFPVSLLRPLLSVDELQPFDEEAVRQAVLEDDMDFIEDKEYAEDTAVQEGTAYAQVYEGEPGLESRIDAYAEGLGSRIEQYVETTVDSVEDAFAERP